MPARTQTPASQPSIPKPQTPPTPNRSPHPGSEKYPAADPSHWTCERLLLLYIDHSMTIADIAFTINRSIVDTIELLESPEFTALADKYAAAQQKRLNFRAQCDRELAASTFARLAEHCDKPETARKAAGSIIRMHTPAKNAATDSSDTTALPDRAHPATKRESPTHNRRSAEDGLPDITIAHQPSAPRAAA